MVKQFEKVGVINFNIDNFVEENLFTNEFSDGWNYFLFSDLTKKGQIAFIDSLIESLQKYKAQI